MLKVEILCETLFAGGGRSIPQTSGDVAKKLQGRINDWTQFMQEGVEVVDVKTTSNHNTSNCGTCFTMTATILYRHKR
jgi:hypothetical protein